MKAIRSFFYYTFPVKLLFSFFFFIWDDFFLLVHPLQITDVWKTWNSSEKQTGQTGYRLKKLRFLFVRNGRLIYMHTFTACYFVEVRKTIPSLLTYYLNASFLLFTKTQVLIFDFWFLSFPRFLFWNVLHLHTAWEGDATHDVARLPLEFISGARPAKIAR